MDALLGLLIIGGVIVMLIGMGSTFSKAGHPGWAAIVPFYNVYVMCKIGQKSGWWVLLVLIPYAGWIFQIIVGVDIAKSFGKGGGFGVGLALLPFIFFPILGFGSARYIVGSELAELEDVFA